MTEPWLRGTLLDVDAVRRQVLHALELAWEDAHRWCEGLTDAEVNARPFQLAPVAFHLRHMARSLDRLLTYAAGDDLSAAQFAALRSELEAGATLAAVMGEFEVGIRDASLRVLSFDPQTYAEVRTVGRERLPTTVGGLLVHCAEHTQRHVGQVITTAHVVKGMRGR
jgi:hypothetical protein